ncbi:uncharacterized protein LOC118779742 [Megalops cyprinoides]|uniref:uncharacterized protein LOC118779742 n=1 Tax=Megalops cyprinoides TaxID=118141 RepID=UPI00186524DC|nr:uncharacterized protein LOC118779742 [Megalops cyprinoides]
MEHAVTGTTPFGNGSGYAMMMVLRWREEEAGTVADDNTPDLLFLLLLKVALNALILSTCSFRLGCSVMGACAGSVVLADALLLLGEAHVWAFSQRLDSSISTCFILAHASSVYSSLPLPAMLLGALDCVVHPPRPGSRPASPARAVCSCLQVLLIWVLACGFSYSGTCTELIEVRYSGVHTAVLCPVRESAVITYSCVALTLAISGTLLFFWREVSLCLRDAFTMWRSPEPALLQSDLPFTYRKDHQGEEKGADAAHWSPQQWEEPGPQPRSSALLSLALGFSLSWAPFLQLSTVCWLLGFSVPSYMTVNLLWLLCVDSLLTGALCWARSEQPGLCADLLDDTYSWSLQGHPPRDIYTLTGRDQERLLQV